MRADSADDWPEDAAADMLGPRICVESDLEGNDISS